MEHGAWGKRAVLRIIYFCLLPFVFCVFPSYVAKSPSRLSPRRLSPVAPSPRRLSPVAPSPRRPVACRLSPRRPVAPSPVACRPSPVARRRLPVACTGLRAHFSAIATAFLPLFEAFPVSLSEMFWLQKYHAREK